MTTKTRDPHEPLPPPAVDPDEVRAFLYVRQESSRMGRTVERVGCPFCKADVRTYLWSRCGSGKRCTCGAMLGGHVARRDRCKLDADG